MTSADLAQVYFYSSRFDETIRQAQKILEINGSFPPAHDLIGMANEQKGMYNAAGGEYQKYFDLGGGGDARMHLAHLYAVMGKPAEAHKFLHEMENPPRGDFVSPYDIASVYAGLGEKEQALAWMDRAYKTRAAMVPMAGINPLLSPLRSEPRFERHTASSWASAIARFECGAKSRGNVNNKLTRMGDCCVSGGYS